MRQCPQIANISQDSVLTLKVYIGCKKSFVTRQELNKRDGHNHNVEFHNQNFIDNVYQNFDLTIFFILAVLAGPPQEVRQMFCLDLVVAW